MSFRASPASCGHRAYLRRRHHIPHERQDVLSKTREFQRNKGTEEEERFGTGSGTDSEQSRFQSGCSTAIAQLNPQSQGTPRLQKMRHSASLLAIKRSEPSLSLNLDFDLDGPPLFSLSVDVSITGTESSVSPTLLPTSSASSTSLSASISATSGTSSASSSTTLSTSIPPSTSSTTSTSLSASPTQSSTSNSASVSSTSTGATLGTSSASSSTTPASASSSSSPTLTSSTSVPTSTPSASLTTTSTTFASTPAISSFPTTSSSSSSSPASTRSPTTSSTTTSVSSSSSLLSSPASFSSAAPTSTELQSSFTDTSTSGMRSTSRTGTASLLHTSSTSSSKSTSSSTTSTSPNASLVPTSSVENDFANNKGAIIGLSIGVVVVLIVSVFAIFLICGRVRGRRALGAADSHATPSARVGTPASRGSRGLSILARGVSGTSSARPMLSRDLSHSTIPWRSPLSDEDGPEEHIEYSGYPSLHGALSMSAAALPGSSPVPVYGGAHAEGGGSSNEDIHGHGTSSNGHEQEQLSESVDGLGPSSKSQMPGFTQAAETLGVGPGSRSRSSLPLISPVTPSSHGHSSSSHQDHLYRTVTMSSLQPTTNASILGIGSGSSNSHSNSGGYSRSTTTTSGLVLPVPKVKVNDQSRPSSLKGRTSTSKPKRGGFIERLRGGRGSNHRIASTGGETPASSSYYPTLPTRSSLLNPPLPEAHGALLEPPPRPFLQLPMPLPSPALTEDSRSNYINGLLSPMGALAGGGGIGMDSDTGNISSVSLRDHVDYSRPFGGFVSNRMDSTTTVATSDTRVTQTPATRLSFFAPTIDDSVAEGEGGRGTSVVDDVDDRNHTRELDRDHSNFSPR